MCGIAGYIGKKKIKKAIIDETLSLMKNRGPDFSNYYQESNQNSSVTFLHSRLSIIDINSRSNQPFEDQNNIIVFNGEIYNFIELKKNLVLQGEKFTTNSDTEVLLRYYKIYGEECVKFFEGMWAFAIYDKRKNHIFLSRDRFAEKPLYYFKDKDGFYFASEIKFIKCLSKENLKINYNHLNRFLSLGYKSLFKVPETFFKNITYLNGSENLTCDARLNIKKNNYWKPKYKKIKKISINECIEESRRLLSQSLKLRIRSDVPIAICLSGGVDSCGLASLLVKDFDHKGKTFSIIDDDPRYDETENINAVLNDLNLKNTKIKLNPANFLDDLKEQIIYHNAPVATISSHVHYLLAKSINNDGYKVAISGVAADEIYTGYYDHYLQHLEACQNSELFEDNLKNWNNFIKDNIRNPNFRNSNLYLNNPKYRDHIFDGRNEINKFLIKKDNTEFFEDSYDSELLTNRRLNELFKENTPLILNQEDLNCMSYSIENRSPFLDSNLFNFIFSIPTKYLIKDGYSKFILRESLNGKLTNQVRLDRKKKGFNASINTLVNFEDKKIRDFLLDKKSKIFEFVDREKIGDLFKEKNLPNHLSKFLFSFISSKLFLDTNDSFIS